MGSHFGGRHTLANLPLRKNLGPITLRVSSLMDSYRVPVASTLPKSPSIAQEKCATKDPGGSGAPSRKSSSFLTAWIRDGALPMQLPVVGYYEANRPVFQKTDIAPDSIQKVEKAERKFESMSVIPSVAFSEIGFPVFW